MFDPEAIEAGVFALLQDGLAGKGFVTISRSMRLWTEQNIPDQPALLFRTIGGAASEPQAPGATQYDWQYLARVYNQAEPDPNAVPQTAQNGLLKAINDALHPPKLRGQPIRLGGMVASVWIEGHVVIEGGLLSQQCVLDVFINARTGI